MTHATTHSNTPIRRGLRGSIERSKARARRRGGLWHQFASEVGQGTVEYVGLLLLMATILAGVVLAAGQLGGKEKIGEKVVNQIGNSIDKAGKDPR